MHIMSMMARFSITDRRFTPSFQKSTSSGGTWYLKVPVFLRRETRWLICHNIYGNAVIRHALVPRRYGTLLGEHTTTTEYWRQEPPK